MNDPREADNRKDEKNLFWKDPCSPSSFLLKELIMNINILYNVLR
jgi:hypothetical protein